MIISNEDILNFDSRYRATFINSLAGIKQVFLIGTKSNDGYSNLGIFNSLIHIGANPPYWGFISRPNTVKRDTLNNIRENGSYTFNFLDKKYFKNAHHTAANYEKEVSEFKAAGFTEEFIDGIYSPFVKESYVKIGMKLEEIIEIKINGTILVIGSIDKVIIDKKIISNDGFVALEQKNNLVCAGLDAYYETKFIDRLEYALPKNNI